MTVELRLEKLLKEIDSQKYISELNEHILESELDKLRSDNTKLHIQISNLKELTKDSMVDKEYYERSKKSKESVQKRLLEKEISLLSSENEELKSIIKSTEDKCDKCEHSEKQKLQNSIDSYTHKYSKLEHDFKCCKMRLYKLEDEMKEINSR